LVHELTCPFNFSDFFHNAELCIVAGDGEMANAGFPRPAILILSRKDAGHAVIPAGMPESSVHGWQTLDSHFS
jgi:hypothetical protein